MHVGCLCVGLSEKNAEGLQMNRTIGLLYVKLIKHYISCAGVHDPQLI